MSGTWRAPLDEQQKLDTTRNVQLSLRSNGSSQCTALNGYRSSSNFSFAIFISIALPRQTIRRGLAWIINRTRTLITEANLPTQLRWTIDNRLQSKACCQHNQQADLAIISIRTLHTCMIYASRICQFGCSCCLHSNGIHGNPVRLSRHTICH